MPKPTLKQKLLRQPTRSYAEALYEDEHTSNEPYWVTAKRHSRGMMTAGYSASTSTLSFDSVPLSSSNRQRPPIPAHVRMESAIGESIVDQAKDNSHVTYHIRPQHLLYNDTMLSTPPAAHSPPSSSSSRKSHIIRPSLSVEPETELKDGLQEIQEREEEKRDKFDVEEFQQDYSHSKMGMEMLTDDARSSIYYTPATSVLQLADMDVSSNAIDHLSPADSANPPLSLPTPIPSPRLAASVPSSSLHRIEAPLSLRLPRADISQSMTSLPTTVSSRTTATTVSASTAGDHEDIFSLASQSRSSLMTSPPSSVYRLSQSFSSTTLPSHNPNHNATTKTEAELALPSQLNPKRRSLHGQAHIEPPMTTSSPSASQQQLAAPRARKPRPESWEKLGVPPDPNSRSSWTPPSPAPTPSPSPKPRSQSQPPSRPLSISSSKSITLSAQERLRAQSTPEFPSVADPSFLNGPSATIGIPFAHPETGLPIVTSIIAVSRQSLGATSGTDVPTHDDDELKSTSGDVRRSMSLRSTSDRRASWRSSVSSIESMYEDALENPEGVTPSSSSPSPHRRNTVCASVTSAPPITRGGSGRKSQHRKASSSAGVPRTIRGQMSFILEEDESGSTSAVTTNIASRGSYLEPINANARYRSAYHERRGRTASLPPTSASSSLPVANPHRRSPSSSVTSGSALPSRSSSPSSMLRIASSATDNRHRTSSRTVDIPYPLPASHSSNGQPISSGASYNTTYGGLVLARAAFKPSKHPDRVSSAIDITKSGLAQTTMGTIEMARGAAASASRRHGSHAHGLGLLGGKFGGNVASLLLKGGGSGAKEAKTPEHLRVKEWANSTPLAFASRVSPPNRLAPSQMLVQVFMVGLDGLDALVVRDKAGFLSASNSSADGEYGFVPGRSFVGRAVECGFEVRNCCKGDWVYGLLDLTKCGALAEFIVVDRRRVCRAPSASKSALTLEQIALLPLCGVPARRAIRTLAAIGPGRTALVLNAHDGVGALLVQSLASQGVEVTAHTPIPSPPSSTAHAHHERDDENENGTDESRSDESRSKSLSTAVATTSVGERVRLLGASHVMCGEPLVIIAGAGAGTFDYVLDTVGGRRIWDASRWILKPGGQFTTLVGDKGAEHPAYEGNSLKSSMRSIRSAMRRTTTLPSPTDVKRLGSEKKHESGNDGGRNVKANGKSKGCGYEWVLPNAELDTEGEDVRDTLVAVAALAEQKVIVPWPKHAIPFEQTPEAFVESRGLLVNGGVVVSKLIG